MVTTDVNPGGYRRLESLGLLYVVSKRVPHGEVFDITVIMDNGPCWQSELSPHVFHANASSARSCASLALKGL